MESRTKLSGAVIGAGTPSGTVVDLTAALARNGQAASDGAKGEASDPFETVAIALTSTLELREVLRTLTNVALGVSGARRCSVFLLDGEVLQPAVAVGTSSDEDLWRAFRAMAPVELAQISGAAARLADLTPIAIECAADSPLIPAHWTESFGLTSLVIAPLHAAGEVCGLMVVDYAKQRSFGSLELARIASIAAYAGVAVRNARTFERSRRNELLQEALARGAKALVAQLAPPEVARVLADSCTSLLPAQGCAIALLDGAQRRIRTLAVGAPPSGTSASPSPSDLQVPELVADRLVATWGRSMKSVEFVSEPFFEELLGPEVHRVTVTPLVVDGRARGAVVLGFAEDVQLSAEERTAFDALTDMAASVLERALLTERIRQNGRRVEILHAISTTLVDGGDALALTERLDGLLAGQGIRVVSLSTIDDALARRIRAVPTTPEPDPAADERVVPLLAGTELVGHLRVRLDVADEETERFLAAIGRGAAEMLLRWSLRAAVDDAARERLLAEERGRIAHELHATISRLFVAISLQARSQSERLPNDSPWRNRFRQLASLADNGQWEIDQSLRALTHVPAGNRTLTTALQQLGSAFEWDSGIQVLVDLDDPMPQLDPELQRLLYAIVHECLINAWRHGRCSLVRVILAVRQQALILEVRDDGQGFAGRVDRRLGGLGLPALRGRLAALGGSLELTNGRPGGAVVRATIPQRRA